MRFVLPSCASPLSKHSLRALPKPSAVPRLDLFFLFLLLLSLPTRQLKAVCTVTAVTRALVVEETFALCKYITNNNQGVAADSLHTRGHEITFDVHWLELKYDFL